MLDNLRRRLWGSGSPAPFAGDVINFLIVYDQANRCLGHLFNRGPAGVEGFDRDDRSLGYFPDLASAAAAVRGAAS